MGFLYPTSLDNFSKEGRASWEAVLGESLRSATKRLLKEGLITQTKDPIHLLQYKYSTDELRNLARQIGVATSGTKEVVARRIVEKDPRFAAQKAKTCRKVYVCTETGRILARQWKEQAYQQRLQAEKAVMQLLQARDFQAAVDTFLAYDRQRPFPLSHMEGFGWRGREGTIKFLKRLWRIKPAILQEIPPKEMHPLRIAAAMTVFFGGRILKRWLPEKQIHPRLENDAAARMILFATLKKDNLAEHRRSSVVKAIKISAAPDACEACKALVGVYPKDNVPELPNPACTNPMGCRCTYIPVIDTS